MGGRGYGAKFVEPDFIHLGKGVKRGGRSSVTLDS